MSVFLFALFALSLCFPLACHSNPPFAFNKRSIVTHLLHAGVLCAIAAQVAYLEDLGQRSVCQLVVARAAAWQAQYLFCSLALLAARKPLVALLANLLGLRVHEDRACLTHPPHHPAALPRAFARLFPRKGPSEESRDSPA